MLLKSRRQVHNVFTTLIIRRQTYNAMPTLPQRWIVNPFHSISWVKKWQRRYSSEISRSNSQRRYYAVAPTLRQLSEEHQMWTIRGYMVTFPQPLQ